MERRQGWNFLKGYVSLGWILHERSVYVKGPIIKIPIHFSPLKGMFNLPPGCIPLEVFNLSNNEFLQNLACTLCAPVWFTTTSIEGLGQF